MREANLGLRVNDTHHEGLNSNAHCPPTREGGEHSKDAGFYDLQIMSARRHSRERARCGTKAKRRREEFAKNGE